MLNANTGNFATIFLNGSQLSIDANVTLTGVSGQIVIVYSNATTASVGLATFGVGALNCPWANVQTDNFGRTFCTSNSVPVTLVSASAPLAVSGCGGGAGCSLSLLAPGAPSKSCQYGTESFDVDGRLSSCTNGSAPITSAGVGTYIRSTNTINTYEASVRDFGALGNGVTDDSAAFQAAMYSGGSGASRRIHIPASAPGYLINSRVKILSYTTIWGDGADSSIIIAGPSLSVTDGLFDQANATNDQFLMTGVSFDGKGYNSTGTQVRNHGYINFAFAFSNVEITRCNFRNLAYHAIVCADCVNFTVSDSNFNNNGFQGTILLGNGGSCIFVGQHASLTSNVQIRNNRFTNLWWKAIQAPNLNNSMISENICIGGGDGCFYVGAGSVVSIVNNVINGTYLRQVGAAGLELSFIRGLVISGNNIRNTQAQPISLSDCQYVTVASNELCNCCTGPGLAANATDYSIIGINQETSSQSLTGMHIWITGNTFCDDQTNATSTQPLRVFLKTATGGLPISNLFVTGNNFASGAWLSGSGVAWVATAPQADTVVCGNIGGVDFIGCGNLTGPIATSPAAYTGTANQITVTGTVLSIPASFTAPGYVAATTNILGGGSAPSFTIGSGANCGSAATAVALSGNNQWMILSLVTGSTTCPGNSLIVTLTFGTQPGITLTHTCGIIPVNTNAQVAGFTGQGTGTLFVMGSPAAGLLPSTSYEWQIGPCGGF